MTEKDSGEVCWATMAGLAGLMIMPPSSSGGGGTDPPELVPPPLPAELPAKSVLIRVEELAALAAPAAAFPPATAACAAADPPKVAAAPATVAPAPATNPTA